MDSDDSERRNAVRATGSPDPGEDPRGPLDRRLDPAVDEPDAIGNAPPDSADVRESSEDSFPASDPPTWTRTASTTAQARSDAAEEVRWDEAAPEIEPPDTERSGS